MGVTNKPKGISFSIDFTSFGFATDSEGFDVILRSANGRLGVGRLSREMASALAKMITERSGGSEGEP